MTQKGLQISHWLVGWIRGSCMEGIDGGWDRLENKGEGDLASFHSIFSSE